MERGYAELRMIIAPLRSSQAVYQAADLADSGDVLVGVDKVYAPVKARSEPLTHLRVPVWSTGRYATEVPSLEGLKMKL